MAFSDKDTFYMTLAIKEARLAADAGDVPVGAVLVCDGEIVSSAHNTKEADRIATGHAEINAINKACEKLDGWRLSDCTLYVTLEPCPMCAGAILSARIPRVVVGTKDAAAGAMGSVWSMQQNPTPMGTCQVGCGCMESECRDLLQTFFQERRKSTQQKN